MILDQVIDRDTDQIFQCIATLRYFAKFNMNPFFRQVDAGFTVKQTAFAALNGIHRQARGDSVRFRPFQVRKGVLANRLDKLAVIRHVAFAHERIRNIPQFLRVFDDTIIDFLLAESVIPTPELPFLVIETVFFRQNFFQNEISVEDGVLVQRQLINHLLHGQRNPRGLFQLLPMTVPPLHIGIAVYGIDECR